MAALKPAYFFYGNDDVKVAAARQRLAQRAQTDGAQLEHFRDESCTPQAVAGAIAMPSLLGGSRIILADGVGKWKAADVGPVADAIGFLAPGEADAHDAQQAVAVFISDKKPLMAIEKAIKAIGGEVKEFKAPSAKALPKWLQEQAKAMGVELDPAAAELMIALVGAERPRYLRSELEKLATYSNGEPITREDVELLGT
ncbi:MAG: hypothetical protein JHC87_09220, partial [Thermoleophilaceae bacterium]|nr:hypothetical protein [Thermoleophilaceae bacterium]